jgi:hypothetical protein
VLGLIPASFLHAFWNSAGYWATDWFSYYLLVQVPLFIVGIAIVASLRRREQRLTKERLAEYASVGWFTPSEVNLLSTGEGRRQAMAWASRNRLGPQYRRFVRDATSLAFTRERLVNGRQGIGSSEEESALLTRLIDDRRAIASLPPLPVRRFGF